MARAFAIELRLSASDLYEFHQLASRRSFTVDAAHHWIAKRGYRVSHGACGTYLRALRSSALFDVRRIAGVPGDDARARNLIAQIAARLIGDDLSHLVLFAQFLACISASRRPLKSAAARDRGMTQLGKDRRDF
jgi:hypothetical protein